MLPSADQLFKDADFIFQQDLAPAHTAKSTARKLTRPDKVIKAKGAPTKYWIHIQ